MSLITRLERAESLRIAVRSLAIQCRILQRWSLPCVPLHYTNFLLVAAQMQEMQLVREKVYQMEQQHLAIKAK